MRFVVLFLLVVPMSIGAQVPQWANHAVWYQIFPERFRNGDPSNDPVRESIEYHDLAPQNWAITPWTSDYYAQADWEKNFQDFYSPPVFLRRYGGDLQGVLDKLPYLKDLGVNALYFNPVFYARSSHKYDGSSFHHIDPYFGPNPQADIAQMARETADPRTWRFTEADKLFLKLIREAHRLGMKIIIDGVFNHSGRDFFAFQDLLQRQSQSPYKDWYDVKSFDDPNTPQNEFQYAGWYGVDTLPEFKETATDLNSGIKAYIWAITKRWMDPNGDGNPQDGIDGWRLDVADQVPQGFWVEWNRYVKRLNRQAYTVAEVWDDASGFIADRRFSATKNYHGFGIPAHDYFIDGRISTAQFVEMMETRVRRYENRKFAVMNLFDSHDTDRFASMVANPDTFLYDRGNSPRWMKSYNIEKPTLQHRYLQRLMAMFQMTYVGAPLIYYGTEAGMWGADDPDDRKPMLWEDLVYDAETHDPRGYHRTADENRFDSALFDYYQALIRLRNQTIALRTGTIHFLGFNEEGKTLTFSRASGRQRLYITLNKSTQPQTIRFPVSGRVSALLLSSRGEEHAIHFQQEGQELVLQVPPLCGVVLR